MSQASDHRSQPYRHRLRRRQTLARESACERRALPQSAVEFHLAAVRLDEPAHDRQPKARALVARGDIVLTLTERLEDETASLKPIRLS